MTLPRRSFLSRSVAAGAAFGGLAALHGRLAARDVPVRLRAPGYGPLMPAGDELALPEGFQYRALGIQGDMMADGVPTPAQHDGMAAFPLPNGNVRLVRNHEITNRRLFGPESTAYDPQAGGGTTSLEVHPETRELLDDFVSLNGTITNCAGGPTPWGTWMSCEEHCYGRAEGWNADHGYVFDVHAGDKRSERARPLVAMGRFKHEAVAVDPTTGIIYETEDFNPTSGFYRFLPANRADLHDGGRLEMMAIGGQPGYDTRRGQTVGARLPVTWVPIHDPDPAGAGADHTLVFAQGWNAGGAVFTRLEGCWWGDGAVYFDATNGGEARLGQIWRYRPDRDELDLVFESPGAEVLKSPDNLCWSPRGGLVVCEDPTGPAFMRGITTDGRIFDFAQNIIDETEFAGATFSPDGHTLFVNIQGGRNRPGITFAIWGPWERGSL
ncbi:MAG: alkaline phosphatase PhoX [Gemmatimonadales bacterium]